MKKQSLTQTHHRNLNQCYPLIALLCLVLPTQGCQPTDAAGKRSSPDTVVAKPLALGNLSHCQRYSGLPDHFGKDPKAGMTYIAAGDLLIGSTQGYADELPLNNPKANHISAFWIDQSEVTNAQFAQFVKATAYVTDAEKLGGGAVFIAPKAGEAMSNNSWWHFVKGANWKQPAGLGSSIAGKAHEPVVQVTKNDAEHYAVWLGHDLPTEAQWEYAAKAVLSNQSTSLDHSAHEAALNKAPQDEHGAPNANYWQGDFPVQNNKTDHFSGIAPVGCYTANSYGLYDMIGNVWEWTQSPYHSRHAYPTDAQKIDLQNTVLQNSWDGHGGNPAAATLSTGHANAVDATPFVIKGGSYLCAANYCVRYRAAARHPQEANLPTNHVGFRTVLNLH